MDQPGGWMEVDLDGLVAHTSAVPTRKLSPENYATICFPKSTLKAPPKLTHIIQMEGWCCFITAQWKGVSADEEDT